MEKNRKRLRFILLTSILLSVMTNARIHAEEGYFGDNESSNAGESTAEENYKKGMAYAIQGKFIKAKKEFENSLKSDPISQKAETVNVFTKDVLAGKINKKAAIYFYKGLSHFPKDLEKAERYYTQSIELDPGYAKTYYKRAQTYGMRKMWKKAIQDMSKTIELKPKFTGAYYFRGLALQSAACTDWETACGLGKCNKINKEREEGNCPF